MKLNTNIHNKQTNTNFIGGTNDNTVYSTTYKIFDGILFIILVSQIVALIYIRDSDAKLHKLNKDYEAKHTADLSISDKDIDLHKTKISSILTTINKYEQFYSYSLTILIVLLIQLTPQTFPTNLLNFDVIEYPETYTGIQIDPNILDFEEEPENILHKFLDIADGTMESPVLAKNSFTLIEDNKIPLTLEKYNPNDYDPNKFQEWSHDLIAYINYKIEQLTNYSSEKDVFYCQEIIHLLQMLNFRDNEKISNISFYDNFAEHRYMKKYTEFIDNELKNFQFINNTKGLRVTNNNDNSEINKQIGLPDIDIILPFTDSNNIYYIDIPYYKNTNFNSYMMSRDVVINIITIIYFIFLLVFNEFDFISTKSPILFILVNCIISYSIYNTKFSPKGHTYAMWASYIIILILSLMSNVGDNYFIEFGNDNRLPIFDIDGWYKIFPIYNQGVTIKEYNEYYRKRMRMKKNLTLEDKETKKSDENKERITKNTKLYLSIKKLFVLVLGVLLGWELIGIYKFGSEVINSVTGKPNVYDKSTNEQFCSQTGEPITIINLITNDTLIENPEIPSKQKAYIFSIIISIIIYMIQMYFYNSIDIITIIYIIISFIYLFNEDSINTVLPKDITFFKEHPRAPKILLTVFIFIISAALCVGAFYTRMNTIDFKVHYQHKKTESLDNYNTKLTKLTERDNTTETIGLIITPIYLLLTLSMVVYTWSVEVDVCNND